MLQKPFVKASLYKFFLSKNASWVLPFVKASLHKFFLSKNASETFCQGFCPFVKGSSSSIAIVGQKGSQVQGGPSIPRILGDLVHLHASCLCLQADRLVVVEDHLHIPTLADSYLPTFSCPHGHYGAVVHQPLLLQPLTLVLHPLPLKVPCEADHPDLHSQGLQPFEACSLPLQLMALDGLEPVHTDPSWQFLLTRNCCATLLTRGCGFTLLTRGTGFTLLTRGRGFTLLTRGRGFTLLTRG